MLQHILLLLLMASVTSGGAMDLYLNENEDIYTLSFEVKSAQRCYSFTCFDNRM